MRCLKDKQRHESLVRVPNSGKAIVKNFEYTRSEKPDHDKKYPLDNRFKDSKGLGRMAILDGALRLRNGGDRLVKFISLHHRVHVRVHVVESDEYHYVHPPPYVGRYHCRSFCVSRWRL